MVMLPDLVRDFRARRKFDVNNYIVNKDGAGAYRESHFREMKFLGHSCINIVRLPELVLDF